eukprot:COSAG04_NODE_2143_length_4696_cov_2.321242_1_plen_37_part_00
MNTPSSRNASRSGLAASPPQPSVYKIQSCLPPPPAT